MTRFGYIIYLVSDQESNFLSAVTSILVEIYEKKHWTYLKANEKAKGTNK